TMPTNNKTSHPTTEPDNAVTTLYFRFPNPPQPPLYTLSLHDALPICREARSGRHYWRHSPRQVPHTASGPLRRRSPAMQRYSPRSEEHTSELQSPDHLVCRLLLEKKKIQMLYVKRSNIMHWHEHGMNE